MHQAGGAMHPEFAAALAKAPKAKAALDAFRRRAARSSAWIVEAKQDATWQAASPLQSSASSDSTLGGADCLSAQRALT